MTDKPKVTPDKLLADRAQMVAEAERFAELRDRLRKVAEAPPVGDSLADRRTAEVLDRAARAVEKGRLQREQEAAETLAQAAAISNYEEDMRVWKLRSQANPDADHSRPLPELPFPWLDESRLGGDG